MGEKVILVYLVVCFFVFLAGFVDSIAGGGGLISLPAYMIAGLPVHTAIATNKMTSFICCNLPLYEKGLYEVENMYSGNFWCDCRVLDGVSSCITHFRQSSQNSNGDRFAGNLILCSQKQSTAGEC